MRRHHVCKCRHISHSSQYLYESHISNRLSMWLRRVLQPGVYKAFYICEWLWTRLMPFFSCISWVKYCQYETLFQTWYWTGQFNSNCVVMSCFLLLFIIIYDAVTIGLMYRTQSEMVAAQRASSLKKTHLVKMECTGKLRRE